MKTLTKLFRGVVEFFRSGKAERVFDQVGAMVPKATSIVEAVAQATPNRTIAEIAAAYRTFGVPVVEHLQATAADQRGYVLLDLATKALAAEYPGVATNLLNAAVQLAVTGVRAK